MSDATIYPVILSGGSGTRLWPLTRASMPKQLLALNCENTLLQETALRARLPNAQPPLVICSEVNRFQVASQMQDAGVASGTIVLEPVGRSTAPAAAVASLLISEKDPQGIVLLLPSDHVVRDTVNFGKAIASANAAAVAGYIVTLGVRPESAETGYGYIEMGPQLAGLGDVAIVQRFIEKPPLEAAESYFASGNFLWNSGIFVFRADVMISEFERLAPAVLQSAKAALSASKRDADFIRLDTEAMENSPSISLDYAIAEKTTKAAVVRSNFGWTDAGTWSSLWSLQKRDADENVLLGDAFAHDTRGSFVRSDKGLAVLVGVEDLAVVVTDDVVLVANRKKPHDVGAAVAKLKASNRAEIFDHARIQRPWGSYQSIDNGDGFQVKEIVVQPGGRLSLQMHHKRAEHWVVVEGTAQVTCDDKVFALNAGQSTFIPLGAKHRLENLGEKPLRLIEVQCGSYLGEDDIVRFEDAYGRANG